MNLQENKHDELTQIKTEQRHYKTFFTSKILNSLKEILDQCFLSNKDKKEHLITREKLVLELLKLLQSQKKFKDTGAIQLDLISTSVLDKETQVCGRILSIDILNREVEFISLYHLREKKKSIIKKFTDVEFFDPHAMAMDYYYRLQRSKHDTFSYADTFAFLTGIIENVHEMKQKKVVNYACPSDNQLKIKIDKRYLSIDIQDT